VTPPVPIGLAAADFDLHATPWAGAVLIALAVAAGAADLRTGKVPNWLTLPAAAVGLLAHALTGGISGGDGRLGLLGSLAGVGMGLVPLLLVWMVGGIGGGDVKLAGAIGALGGWRFALATLTYGIIAAVLMAVVIMVYKKLVRRTLRRVWHTLVLLVIPGARPADPTGADSPRIPFAVALCVGAAGALAELALRARAG